MTDPLPRYHQLLDEVAAAMAPLLARHRATMQCGPRCTDCCQALSLLAIEAQMVATAYQALPPATQAAIRAMIGSRARETDAQCPFLLDGLCAIYPARPLICRTHGLAIGYVDEEREVIEVSACALNFAEDFPLITEDLLLLDPFNARLAALNQEFAEAMGLAAATRVGMQEIVLAHAAS